MTQKLYVLVPLILATLSWGCASTKEAATSPCASCVTSDAEVTLKPINHQKYYRTR